MNQVSDLIDSLLKIEWSDATALVDQVVNNPLANLQASLLLLAAVIVVTLLAIMIVIVFIGFGGDDDEDDEYEHAEYEEPTSPEQPPAENVVTPPRARTPEERRSAFAVGALISMLGVLIVWVLLGVTTGSETMCLSCHSGSMPHTDRLSEDGGSDPHAATSCVRCHESGGVAAGLTYNVPARVVHFAQGMAIPERATRFGLPVASSACSSCHGDVGKRTITVEERGVRVSHKEPLAAGATCVDCHEMQKTSGSVGAWTVGMSACLRCHDNKQASAECGDCHTKDIAYAVHVNRQPQPRRLVREKQCYTCHEQRACDSCHGLSMPHTAEFINSGHPRAATLDNWYNEGKTCKKCHTAKRNPCTKCHIRGKFPGHPINVWPTIHGNEPQAGLGACNACHGTMAKVEGRNFCGVCHDQYKNLK